jgi:hypothetical protein
MKKRSDLCLVFALVIGLCGCAESAQENGLGSGDGSGSVDGSGSGDGSGTVAFDFAAPGPFRVGVRSVPLSDATRSRA